VASIFLCRIVFAFVIARKGAGAVAGRSRLAAARKNGTAGLHYPKNIAHAQDNAILCRTVWDFVREGESYLQGCPRVKDVAHPILLKIRGPLPLVVSGW
jgi:hypothetical protein